MTKFITVVLSEDKKPDIEYTGPISLAEYEELRKMIENKQLPGQWTGNYGRPV
jgi:hypothetical protein